MGVLSADFMRSKRRLGRMSCGPLLRISECLTFCVVKGKQLSIFCFLFSLSQQLKPRGTIGLLIGEWRDILCPGQYHTKSLLDGYISWDIWSMLCSACFSLVISSFQLFGLLPVVSIEEAQVFSPEGLASFVASLWWWRKRFSDTSTKVWLQRPQWFIFLFIFMGGFFVYVLATIVLESFALSFFFRMGWPWLLLLLLLLISDVRRSISINNLFIVRKPQVWQKFDLRVHFHCFNGLF